MIKIIAWSILGSLVVLACQKKPQSFDKDVFATTYARNFRLSARQAQVWGLGYGLTDTLTLPKPPKPWQRVACLSATHLAMIEALDQLHKLKALQYGEWVYSPQVQQALQSGQIADLGKGEAVATEQLIDLQIEAVFVFGMQASAFQAFKNWQDLGIAVVPVGEWMEADPLGRSEWLKFFGFFLDVPQRADSIFRAVEHNYLKIKSKPCQNSLSVIAGIGYSGQWAAPGGKSYMAKLLADACGDYVFKSDTSRGSISMGLEAFLLAAQPAKIWLNVGTARSRKQLLEIEPRLAYIIEHKQIFNCTRRVSPQGGFDFYESGVWRPDMILSDLRQILQGHELHEGFYYQQIE